MIEIKNLKKSFLGLAQPVIDNMNFRSGNNSDRWT